MFQIPYDQFTRTEDFGIAAVFDGTNVINGIAGNAYATVDGIATSTPTFECVGSSVPSAIGKSLVVDGTSYTIVGIRPDGYGWVILDLEVP